MSVLVEYPISIHYPGAYANGTKAVLWILLWLWLSVDAGSGPAKYELHSANTEHLSDLTAF